MLGMLKTAMNSLKKSDPTVSTEASSILADAHDDLKGKQMHRGRTRKTVEGLTAEVESLRQYEAHARQHLGKCELNGVDTTEAEAALQRAEGRVRARESALTVAIQKDDAAQAALKTAERLALVNTEYAALAHLKLIVGPKADKLLDDLEHFIANELAPPLDAARLAGGPGIHTNFLLDLSLSWELYIYRACRLVMPSGRILPPMLGNKTWSDRIPSPDYAKTRKRDE